MRTTADPKKLVRALQTGRRKLGMTDEDYRGLLSSVTGGRTTSSKELSGEELARALAALRIEEPAAREHLQHFFSEQQPATAVMQ